MREGGGVREVDLKARTKRFAIDVIRLSVGYPIGRN
jgi:hypothetical protein